MMQADKSDTFILSTGVSTSVREFIQMSFEAVGISIEFKGNGINEYAINALTGDVVVKINSKFYRPAEKHILLGSPSKAAKVLGWRAQTDVRKLCDMMINHYIDIHKDNRYNFITK